MMSPAQQAFLDWWFDEDQDTETDVVFFNRMMHADPVLAAEINRRAAQETIPARMQELNAKYAGRERGDDGGELTPKLSEQP